MSNPLHYWSGADGPRHQGGELMKNPGPAEPSLHMCRNSSWPARAHAQDVSSPGIDMITLWRARAPAAIWHRGGGGRAWTSRV